MAKPKFGHFTKMGGLKLYPPLLKYMGVDGLADVKRRTDLSVSYSPFGWVDEGGTVVVKGAPYAKGKTIDELAKSDIGQAILGGLKQAIALSRNHTEEGVAIVNIKGRPKRMPLKAASMMREGKKAKKVTSIAQVY